MTTRRGFLASLIGAAFAMQLDPEKEIWVPGEKVISIPKPPTIYIVEKIGTATLLYMGCGQMDTRSGNGLVFQNRMAANDFATRIRYA